MIQKYYKINLKQKKIIFFLKHNHRQITVTRPWTENLSMLFLTIDQIHSIPHPFSLFFLHIERLAFCFML